MAHTSKGIEYGSFYERSGRARPAVYERHKRGLPTCERPLPSKQPKPASSSVSADIAAKRRRLDLAEAGISRPAARSYSASSLAAKRRHVAALEAEMAQPLETPGRLSARRVNVQQEKRRLERMEQENNRKFQHERLQSGLPVGGLRWNGAQHEIQWQERSPLSGW